jgi:hypothetical protein
LGSRHRLALPGDTRSEPAKNGLETQFLMNTGVPSGTRRISISRSESAARRHPAEAAEPIVPGELVPWIATRLPPRQPAGRLGWWAFRARMQQP